MKIIIAGLMIFFSSFLYAELEFRNVGWNNYKWGDGKYFINDVLVYKKPVDVVPDESTAYEDKCWSENGVYALAMFSNIVTLRTAGNETCSGMARPNHWADITSYRVENGAVKQVSLNDLFPENVILEQLYQDSYLRKKYPENTRENIKKDFEKVHEVCEAVDKSTLNNFVIHYVNGEQVAVRLFLRTCGNAAVKLTKQIGFYLPAYGTLLEEIKLSSENKLLMNSLSPD